MAGLHESCYAARHPFGLGSTVPVGTQGRGRPELVLDGTRALYAPDRVAQAQAYTRQASQALALAIRLAGHKEAETDVPEAMKSRTVIDMAVGIIMSKTGCRQEEAFTTLRPVSSSRNIKLHEVAAGVLGGAGVEPATTHFDR